ncbi:hypothetical protein NL676_032834 [Syzygium grande]|nr:hypothetical protein NL676_032834 [Syzygium grande]
MPPRCMSSPATTAYSEDAPSKVALISLKNHIAYDPFGVMSSWNDSLPFCNWTGVRCSRRHKERVTALNLMDHQLVGSIPASIGNLSFLQYLYLAGIGFPGSDPSGGKMSRLKFLKISGNNFSGTIPPSVYNLTSLLFLDVGNNRLRDEIRPDIGFALPNLEGLYVGRNSFTGKIPVSLPNATGLVELDFAVNSFSGTLPLNLGNLERLSRLVFHENELTNLKDDCFSFMNSFTNCSGLQILDTSTNQFEGALPPSVSNFSSELGWLLLGSNQISGKIPSGIESLKGITRLDMSRNFLTGVIPENIGKLHKLLEVDLSHNNISGAIPPSFGNISQLTRLFLQENRL